MIGNSKWLISGPGSRDIPPTTGDSRRERTFKSPGDCLQGDVAYPRPLFDIGPTEFHYKDPSCYRNERGMTYGMLVGPDQPPGHAPLMSTIQRIMFIHEAYGSDVPSGENVVAAVDAQVLRSVGFDVRSVTVTEDRQRLRSRISAGFTYLGNPRAVRSLRALVHDFQPDIVHIYNLFPRLSPLLLRLASDRPSSVVVQSLQNYRYVCPAGTLYRNGQVCRLCVTLSFAGPGIRYGCYRNSRASTVPIAISHALHRAAGTFSKPQIYIAASQFVKDVYVEAGFPESQIEARLNFAAPPQTTTRTRRTAQFSILFAARLTDEKGTLDVLEMAPSVTARGGVIEVAGTGPLAPELRAADRRGELRYLGRLDHFAVLERIARASAVLVPSRWPEPFGLTVAEAFARGVPVVAYRSGGIPEMVHHLRNGLLVETGNVTQLAEAVRLLLTNAKLRDTLSTGALDTYRTQLSKDVFVRRTLDIYERARQIKTLNAGG